MSNLASLVPGLHDTPGRLNDILYCVDVLVVDDSPVIRRVLQLAFQPHGNCDVVQNGQQALDSISSRLEASKPYDIICLDLGLPDLAGVDVLKEIRSREAQHGNQVRSRIVIVSGSAEPDVVRAAHQNGADAYLVKPIDKQQLLNVLQGLGFKAGS